MYYRSYSKPLGVSSALAAALLALSACGRGMTGTYADDGNVTAYGFCRDGRATIQVLGTYVAAEYTLDGDRVLVTSPQGTVVLRRAGDRLIGPMGLELKQREQKNGGNVEEDCIRQHAGS